MDREEILERSRKENRNKDLAELDAQVKAGNIAGRVGACVCLLTSAIFVWAMDMVPMTPWIICFSIIGTNYLVRYVKMKRKTDLALTILYFAVCILSFVQFVLRLLEAKA